MAVTYTTDLFRRNWPDHYQRSRPLTALEHRGLILEQTNYNQSKIRQQLKVEWDTEPANLFIFSGLDSQQIRLYYGHQIKPLRTENGTTLIDVFHTGNTTYSNWTPDFLVELKRRDVSAYAIFDSKYTKPSVAIKQYLPELTMKYIHGIGSQYGGYSPVKALFFLCPRLETSDADFYQPYHNERFGIFSNNPIIPALGGVTLTPSVANQAEIETEKERFVQVLNQVLILLENWCWLPKP